MIGFGLPLLTRYLHFKFLFVEISAITGGFSEGGFCEL